MLTIFIVSVMDVSKGLLIMLDYRNKIINIKEKLSGLNETYFDELCLADRQQLIEITEYCNQFLYTPNNLELLDSLWIELNYLDSYNKMSRERRHSFKSGIKEITTSVKEMMEE